MLRRNRDRFNQTFAAFSSRDEVRNFSTITSFLELLGFETHSLPALARCFPRSFAFYVAHPIRSILF
jgi:hypothetical protein